MTGRRTEKVASLLQREVAVFIERKVKNPGVGFVTVTGVRLADDLKHAKILVVCRGDDEQKERSLGILNRCVPHIRRALKKVLTIRQVPELVFLSDPSFDLADRVHGLLGDIRDEDRPE